MGFEGNRLIGCDGGHLIDIVDRSATAQVIDGCSHSLENRTDGFGTSEALYELVADVSCFEGVR